MNPLEEAADAIDNDDEIAWNIILGGPAYVSYWLRERASKESPHSDPLHAKRVTPE